MNTYIQKLQQNAALQLYAREGFTYLGLFGSSARNEARSDSDVDLLVEFSKPKSFFELADIQFSLENILKKKVDLVFKNKVKKLLRPSIEHDLVTIYEQS